MRARIAAAVGLLRAVALGLLVVTACACTPPVVKGNPPAPRMDSMPTSTDVPYVMQPGDVLSIKFYRNPELNEEVTIRPDGKITLQLVEDVRAAGLSPESLGEDLKDRYRKELAHPDVTVIVKSFSGQRVYVSGEVGTSGLQTLQGQTSLYQAIQQAGGFLISAKRDQVLLIRRGPDGRPRGESIDLEMVENGTDPQQDVMLRPYDIVFVPKSRIAEVNTFVELYVTRNLPPAVALLIGYGLW
ncbi:MAG: polysaccharide biosynthesis/export family protein [Alphaproteobacteria bacterium]